MVMTLTQMAWMMLTGCAGKLHTVVESAMPKCVKSSPTQIKGTLISLFLCRAEKDRIRMRESRLRTKLSDPEKYAATMKANALR